MSVRQWFRHAFAVDPPGPAEPTPAQRKPVDWLARQIAGRHLTTPGLITLEMCRPMNWFIAQGMHMTEPAVWAVTPQPFFDGYRQFAGFLEQRGSIEYLCRRLEEIEAECANNARAGADAKAQADAGAERRTSDL